MLDLKNIGLGAERKVRELFRLVVGGRYSRGAWALATVGIVAAVCLLFLPIGTFLWTSPKALQGVYLWSAGLVVAFCVAALGLVFAKRLQDQNLNGLWALLALIAYPIAVGFALQALASYHFNAGNYAAYAPLEFVVLLLFPVPVLVLALRAPRSAAERYGPRTEAADLLHLRHPLVILVMIVAAILIPLSVYAGLIQDGLWVGRKEHSFYRGPSIKPPGGGVVLAQCGNAKGVSAQAEFGPEGGFSRDAFGGTWSLVVLPDGTLDIQTYSDSQVLSYRQDGFTITATGIRLNYFGWLEKEVNRFQVVARFDATEGNPWSTDNTTVMTFVRSEYDYRALITSTRFVGDGGGPPEEAARASSVLVMADCKVTQENSPKAER